MTARRQKQVRAHPGMASRSLLRLVALSAFLLLGAVLVAGAVGGGSVAAKSRSNGCSDNRDKALRLNLKVGGERTFGYFALPRRKPRGLVVFGHGYTYSAISWRPILRQAAKRNGVVAVAMNYRHQPTNLDRSSPLYGRSTGWRVLEGAKDSTAAARYMIRRCSLLKRRKVVAYGVSMGAAATGLSISARAKRAGSARPLFDYWFAVEGVTDIATTYLATRATGDPIAPQIEQDFGGTYEERTGFYKRHSIVNRAARIKASAIKGVVMVVATDDPLYVLNKLMFERLRGVGARSQLFAIKPSGAPVGHGTEIVRTHPVIRTGLERLAALFKRGVRPRSFEEFTVDASSGAITPGPAAP